MEKTRILQEDDIAPITDEEIDAIFENVADPDISGSIENYEGDVSDDEIDAILNSI